MGWMPSLNGRVGGLSVSKDRRRSRGMEEAVSRMSGEAGDRQL